MADFDWLSTLPQWLGGTQGVVPASKFGGLYGGTASGLDPSSFPEPPIPPGTDTSVAAPAGWGAGGYDSSPTAGSGISSKAVADALGAAGKSAGAGQQGAGAAASKAGAPQLGQAPLGQPRAAVNLDNLVKLLAARREALMPGSAGAAPGGGRVQGLLGF